TAKLADGGWGINAQPREQRARAHRSRGEPGEQVLRDGAGLARDGADAGRVLERTRGEGRQRAYRRGGERADDLARRHAPAAREATPLDDEERRVAMAQVGAASAAPVDRRLVARRRE